MRLIFVLTMVVGWQATVFAETAYEALQVVKGVGGSRVLDRLVEARGENGDPQPVTWTLIMNDPSARGGIREFVVTRGSISSERTPVRTAASLDKLDPINFAKLNLDSDGAFDIANKEALRARVGFDSINYTLAMDPATGSPVWNLKLFDFMGAPVGNLLVSAETGRLVQSLRIDPDARQATVPPPQQGAVSASPSGDREPMGGVIGAVERRVTTGATTVKDAGLSIAGSIQRFLTGRDTVSPDADETE